MQEDKTKYIVMEWKAYSVIREKMANLSIKKQISIQNVPGVDYIDNCERDLLTNRAKCLNYVN